MPHSKVEPFKDLVGTVSDSVVAKKAGVTRAAVALYRRTRGIPAHKQPIDWSVIPLGKVTDVQIAAEYGISIQAIGLQRQQRGIPRASKSSFANLTDEDLFDQHYLEVARKTGSHWSAVHAERRRRRGPAYHRVNWSQQAVFLGTMTDSTLARKLGISTAAVCWQRKQRGILAYTKRTKS